MSISEKLKTIAENEQKVYAAGSLAEYDKFWDGFQDNGNRSNYDHAFAGVGWNDKTLKPKYKNITPTSAGNIFYRCGYTGDLRDVFDSIDFSKVSSLVNAFSASSIAAIGIVSTIGCSALSAIFPNATNLETIEKLILKDDGSQTISSLFGSGVKKLKNLTIVGTIGAGGFDVAYCTLLTHDSLMSIINALKDYSGSGATYTVTLGATNLAKLTDAEKAIASQKGWSLA